MTTQHTPTPYANEIQRAISTAQDYSKNSPYWEHRHGQADLNALDWLSANAVKIHALDDMLAALRALMEWVPSTSCGPGEAADVERARAAIAKATEAQS